jgi:hypothetical protein
MLACQVLLSWKEGPAYTEIDRNLMAARTTTQNFMPTDLTVVRPLRVLIVGSIIANYH